MTLAWADRSATYKKYHLQRDVRLPLFKESINNYCLRFFGEIKYLGNINVYKIRGNKARLLFQKEL